MAEVAQGTNCPGCGSLIACSGKRSDEELVGQCTICNRSIHVGNASFVPHHDVERAALRTQLEGKHAENGALLAQIADLKKKVEQAKELGFLAADDEPAPVPDDEQPYEGTADAKPDAQA